MTARDTEVHEHRNIRRRRKINAGFRSVHGWLPAQRAEYVKAAMAECAEAVEAAESDPKYDEAPE